MLGLWIEGHEILNSDQDFQRYLKYAIVPIEDQKSSFFLNGTKADILSLADPMSLQIVQAMQSDYVAHVWRDVAELQDNIKLRKGVMQFMHDLTCGTFDGDYAEPDQGIPDTLGLVPTSPAQKNSFWTNLGADDPWGGFTFQQIRDHTLGEALDHISPFRGECAGALQLAILKGCEKALGPDSIDAVGAKYGPAYIGTWHIPLSPNPSKDSKTKPTLAASFMAKVEDFPKDYKRNSVLGVPGDYFYFKNKDGYSGLTDDKGGWTGENCIYMGKDLLGGAHYSGMGLTWKTEFAYRMFLRNAYTFDCNTKFIGSMRNGDPDPADCHIVEDPLAQVRFTERCLIRYPDLDADVGPVVEEDYASVYNPPLKDPEGRLADLGFEQVGRDVWVMDNVPLIHLVDGLGFSPSSLRQTPSAPRTSPPLTTIFGDWRLLVKSVDPNAPIQSVGAEVSAKMVRAR